MIDQLDAETHIASCDAPDCPATGEARLKFNDRAEMVMAILPDHWRSVTVLGEQQHFCQPHSEKWL